MNRIQLEMPEDIRFVTEMKIRVSDLNYGGHLGNDAVLSLVHEARMRYLEDLGRSEEDIGGVSLIMADAAVEFRSEGFHGEAVRVEVAPGEVSRTGFDLYYRLNRISPETTLAVVKTGMVGYDYEQENVASLPESFSSQLESGNS